MNVNEIKSNIRYNENLIDQFYSEKLSIEKKIEELEQLRNKFGTLQSNFAAKQDKRQQGIAGFCKTSVNNKIYSSYLSGMTELLKGKEFNSAYEGLTTAKEKINVKLKKLLNDLYECENKISYRQGRKIYWQDQLRFALVKEEK